MKDLEKIEKLLEKYYKGETSIEEEEKLRDLFSGGEVPDHLKADAWLFRFFRSERSSELPGSLEKKLAESISYGKSAQLRQGQSTERDTSRKPGLKLSPYWLSGIAAAILILAGIFVDLRIRRNSSMIARRDTYEDPYMAYNEAKRVLFLVSEKMNTATEPLKNIERLDEGVYYMQPVFSFGKGMQYMGRFSKIEKTRELISK